MCRIGHGLDVVRAALSLNESRVPAVESRGESVFIGVDAGAIKAWLGRDAVKTRGAQLLAGFSTPIEAGPPIDRFPI